MKNIPLKTEQVGNSNSASSSIAVESSYQLQAALSYGERGWRVLPVTDTKVPMIKGWPKFASADPEQIKQWWTKHPVANIGIATGPGSGIWVLDIDVKNGVNGWSSIRDRFGNIDLNVNDLGVTSPSGGYHLYYRWDSSLPVTVAANVLPGIDIRGETGFIIAPPSSVLINDRECLYQFNDKTKTIPDAPEWARELARMTLSTVTTIASQKTTSQFDVEEVMVGISEGGRDNALFRYACHLRGCEVPYEIAAGFLLEAASRCIPAFDGNIAVEKLNRVYATLPKCKNIFSLKQGG
jgi:hypothetical protein